MAMAEYVAPFRGQQASRRWQDYYRNREKRPVHPWDGQGSDDAAYMTYRHLVEARGSIPVEYATWRFGNDRDLLNPP